MRASSAAVLLRRPGGTEWLSVVLSPWWLAASDTGPEWAPEPRHDHHQHPRLRHTVHLRQPVGISTPARINKGNDNDMLTYLIQRMDKTINKWSFNGEFLMAQFAPVPIIKIFTGLAKKWQHIAPPCCCNIATSCEALNIYNYWHLMWICIYLVRIALHFPSMWIIWPSVGCFVKWITVNQRIRVQI